MSLRGQYRKRDHATLFFPFAYNSSQLSPPEMLVYKVWRDRVSSIRGCLRMDIIAGIVLLLEAFTGRPLFSTASKLRGIRRCIPCRAWAFRNAVLLLKPNGFHLDHPEELFSWVASRQARALQFLETKQASRYLPGDNKHKIQRSEAI